MPWQRAAEREVEDDREQDGRDRGGTDRPDAPATPARLAAPAPAPDHFPTPGGGDVVSVFSPWLPGTLPIRWPLRYGSLPTSHSGVWPGASALPYGLKCRFGEGLARACDSSVFATTSVRNQVPESSPSEIVESTLRVHRPR